MAECGATVAETDGEGFLGRWARRKQAEAPVVADAAVVVGEEGGTPEAEPPLTAEEVAALPDIDELDENSDYTQFLRDGVPDALRRLALRRLWRLNPIIAHRDGLNEYDEDFNDIKLVGDAVKTIYKAGRGYFAAEEKKTPVRPSEDNPLPAWEVSETAAAEDAEESGAEGPGAEGSGAETADREDGNAGDDRATTRVGEEVDAPLATEAAGEIPGGDSGEAVVGELATDAAALGEAALVESAGGEAAGARNESLPEVTDGAAKATKSLGESGAAVRRRWGQFQA